MKPFDLEKALSGAPVVTRCGERVHDIYVSKHFLDNGVHYPVIGIIAHDDGPSKWSVDGERNIPEGAHEDDLFMAPQIMYAALLEINGEFQEWYGNTFGLPADEVDVDMALTDAQVYEQRLFWDDLKEDITYREALFEMFHSGVYFSVPAMVATTEY